MANITLTTAEPPLVLALDVGTSSLRAMVFDRLGRAVEELAERVEYEVQSADDGTVELDPTQLLARVGEALDRLHPRLEVNGVEVAAVAVDTFAPSVIGLDAARRPLTPVYLWADTRAWQDARTLREVFDETAVHDLTGCPIHASYVPARVRWLRRTQPDLARQIRRFASFGEFLDLSFFGVSRVSHSLASWSGLMNRRTLVWEQEWLQHLDLDESLLSPLVNRDAAANGLAGQYSVRWPLLANVPWYPAIGDGAAANVGSGCLGPRRAALTIGTSGALRLALEGTVERVPWGLWCYRVDRTRCLLGGALSEGGNVYAWLRGTLQLGDARSVEAAVTAMEPDAHGLTVLPFVAGERSPGWAERARAAIVGANLNTSPHEIVRAALESVAYRFALVDRLLEHAMPAQRDIVASGGALTVSPVWLQILADVLGRPITVSTEEATARGTALLALQALGALRSLEVTHATGRTYQPNAARHTRYQEAIERQSRLYALLIDRDADERRQE